MDKTEEKVKYSPKEVFEALGKENLALNRVEDKKKDISFHGFAVHAQSLRYMTFYQNGLVCRLCGKEGKYFALDSQGKDDSNRRHFNLYTEDGMLMVKDRIMPKEIGGCSRISNMQTLCRTCSEKKRKELVVSMKKQDTFKKK